MSQCLETDALLTVGDALDWKVEDGLRHLQDCETCRAELEALRIAHAGLADVEPVGADAIRAVTDAVHAAAARERTQMHARARLLQWVEPVLAGVTALVIVSSSRVPIDGFGAAVLAFALGIALLLAGRSLARRISVLQPEPVDA